MWKKTFETIPNCHVSWPVGQPVDTGLPKKDETTGTNVHLDPSVKNVLTV